MIKTEQRCCGWKIVAHLFLGHPVDSRILGDKQVITYNIAAKMNWL